MAILTLQTIDLAGLEDFTLASATGGGDEFVNDGRTILVVDNASGSPIVVTVDSKVLSDYGTDEDNVVSVAAGSRAFIGPFQKDRFNGTGQLASISYDGVTSLTVAALQLHERGW